MYPAHFRRSKWQVGFSRAAKYFAQATAAASMSSAATASFSSDSPGRSKSIAAQRSPSVTRTASGCSALDTPAITVTNTKATMRLMISSSVLVLVEYLAACGQTVA